MCRRSSATLNSWNESSPDLSASSSLKIDSATTRSRSDAAICADSAMLRLPLVSRRAAMARMVLRNLLIVAGATSTPKSWNTSGSASLSPRESMYMRLSVLSTYGDTCTLMVMRGRSMSPFAWESIAVDGRAASPIPNPPPPELAPAPGRRPGGSGNSSASSRAACAPAANCCARCFSSTRSRALSADCRLATFFSSARKMPGPLSPDSSTSFSAPASCSNSLLVPGGTLVKLMPATSASSLGIFASAASASLRRFSLVSLSVAMRFAVTVAAFAPAVFWMNSICFAAATASSASATMRSKTSTAVASFGDWCRSRMPTMHASMTSMTSLMSATCTSASSGISGGRRTRTTWTSCSTSSMDGAPSSRARARAAAMAFCASSLSASCFCCRRRFSCAPSSRRSFCFVFLTNLYRPFACSADGPPPPPCNCGSSADVSKSPSSPEPPLVVGKRGGDMVLAPGKRGSSSS
mmetsp:Transcript_41658/g.128700  ORF Transcript_41658/g.128700 Transcript_41658/m.128700 type:complete len:467 (-) Transcript_41658:728-2128(-)